MRLRVVEVFVIHVRLNLELLLWTSESERGTTKSCHFIQWRVWYRHGLNLPLADSIQVKACASNV